MTNTEHTTNEEEQCSTTKSLLTHFVHLQIWIIFANSTHCYFHKFQRYVSSRSEKLLSIMLKLELHHVKLS